MTKYVFITGGVLSSLGKGIAAASLASILESRGLKVTILKFDPYINVDPGTMSPFQHGEVFVTEDGAETDLDLGHYERFIDAKMNKNNNVTTGQVYEQVIANERKGVYLGATIQVIPHVIDEITRRIELGAKGSDIALVEIGGTVGDIESLPYLEAIRQFRAQIGTKNGIFMHLTLVPYIPTAGEVKTKPTQHSVKELRSIGIQPDILLCRSELPVAESERKKISLFTNVPMEAVISCSDKESIYAVPLSLHANGLDDIVLDRLDLKAQEPDLSAWQAVLDKQREAKSELNVVMVGKYTGLSDAYKSLNEALAHAGIYNKSKVKINYLDAEVLEKGDLSTLEAADAILVPGGFGQRGIEGKIIAAKYARENKVPYLGICLGMQVAVIEYARNMAGMTDANSTEINPDTKHPVIALVTEWVTEHGEIETRDENSNLGGTMRLGAQICKLVPGTLAAKSYNSKLISERHRHRYEVNSTLVKDLEKSGLKVSGFAEKDDLVEIIEIKDHPWFLGCQFHPEFTSNPKGGHPLFNSYIKAALDNKR